MGKFTEPAHRISPRETGDERTENKMAKERKHETTDDQNVTPRVLANEFGTTPYKVRKTLRQHANDLEHAKNSRWQFSPDGDELKRAREILSAKFGE